jgi:cytoskeletal protein CcmA (bactofilin family)
VPAPEPSARSREFFPNDSDREFADFPTDPNASFEAWLDSLRSSPKPIENSAPVSAFTFEGSLRIDCSVTGIVNSQTGALVVSETAELNGNVFVPTAIVDGLVRGDIRAIERVELGATARVFGNIETPALAIQPGAVFEGQCHFLPPLTETNDEQIAPSSADDSTVPRGSSPRRSKANQPQEAEPFAVAAGR